MLRTLLETLKILSGSLYFDLAYFDSQWYVSFVLDNYFDENVNRKIYEFHFSRL